MAMQNVFNVLVDLEIAKSVPQPLVTQNDSVVFILEVMKNGVAFDLTDTTTVSLAHTRKDKSVVVTPGTKSGNKATFVLGTNETSVTGAVAAKAQFYDANGRVSTLSFTYQVGLDPTGSGYIPSASEATLIEVVLNDGPLIIQSAEEAAAYANEQGDYALQVGVENETRYLNAVSTVALRDATYPLPAHGDTVRITELGRTDRYVLGVGWVTTDVYNPVVIDELSSQLAETSKHIPNVANALEVLKILNPYGNYQNIHPKVLYFDTAWNGFKFWMAYTPYTKGNVAQENPCISASNDGVKWVTPVGVVNPLEPYSGVVTNYNNDTHLVYRADINTLEIWWRNANVTTGVSTIRRRTTTDGSTWTPTEDVLVGGVDYLDHLSPTVIYEDNKYKMWSVARVDTYDNLKIIYCESVNGTLGTWSADTIMEFGTDVIPWHIDMIKSDLGYEFIIQEWQPSIGNNYSSLYHMTTTDLINFTKPKEIISPSKSFNTFDNQGIYRSSFIKKDGMYYVYYSAIDRDANRGLSLSYGENIEGLKGFQFLKKQIETNVDITNVVDIKQATNPNTWGGLKLGNLLFANGVTDGVTPQAGSIRFATSTGKHQRYDLPKVKWVDLVPTSNKKALVGKNVAQVLTPNTFVPLTFAQMYFMDEGFANNAFTVPESAMYRFNLGITITGMAAGDDLEIWLYRNGASSRPIFNQKVSPTTAGTYFASGSTVYNLTKDDVMTIQAKYIGSATATITQYPYHNTLLIEMI